MKVLFLDIDGVLNSGERAHMGIPYETFNPDALVWLRFLHVNRVSIVVSSSWRNHHSKAFLQEALTIPVFGMTPWLRGPPRGEEIAAWLRGHPRVKQYAIIDDDSDMLPEQQKSFVQTNHETGMQVHHFEALCRLLNVPIPS